MKKYWFQTLAAIATLMASTSTAFAGLPPTGSGSNCYYTAPVRLTKINRGDIILTTSSSGVIHDLMASIGQTYTHSGVAVSSSSMRHNSMDMGKIKKTYGPLGVVPDGLVGSSLRNGLPGMATTSLSDNGWLASSSLVLSGPSAYATQRQRVASAMEGMDGYYRLYAYTNMTWKTPTVRAAGDGNMCSGTIAHAMFRAGLMSNTTRQSYDADTRMTAAKALYSSVRNKVINGVDGFADFITRDARISNIATGIANQVVNCMAFDSCADDTDRWRNGVGTGSTLSPDDLGSIVAWASAFASAGYAVTFPYQSLTNVQWKASQYCCDVPALGSLPATHTCS